MATLRYFSPFARGCFDFGIAKVGIKIKTANFFDIFFEKSVKKIFQLVKKALVFLGRIRFEGLFVTEGLDDRLLFSVELLRNPYGKFYVEIADSAISVDGREAFVAQPYYSAGLCAGVNLYFIWPVKARYFHLCSEDGIRH